MPEKKVLRVTIPFDKSDWEYLKHLAGLIGTSGTQMVRELVANYVDFMSKCMPKGSKVDAIRLVRQSMIMMTKAFQELAETLEGVEGVSGGVDLAEKK